MLYIIIGIAIFIVYPFCIVAVPEKNTFILAAIVSIPVVFLVWFCFLK